METEVQIHVLGLNPFGDNFELNTNDIDEAIEYLEEIKRKIDEDDWETEGE